MNGDSRLSPPQNQAEAHYKGHKHASKLKAVEAAKSKQRPQTLTQDEMMVPPTPTPCRAWEMRCGGPVHTGPGVHTGVVQGCGFEDVISA